MQFNLLALLRILNLQHLRLLNVVKYGYGTYDLPFFLKQFFTEISVGVHTDLLLMLQTMTIN